MKKIKKFIALTMLAAAPFALTGCDEEDSDYTLSFIANKNKVYYSVVSSGNEKIDLPEEPSKKGYTFGGWYLDENYTTPFTSESFANKDLEGNLNIYAKWDTINYNINYHLDGGTNGVNNPASYNINTNFNLENPTKSEYTFVGWYLDEAYNTPITNINGEYKGELNIYAKWSIYDYEIIYHLNGGVNSNNNPSGYDKNNNEIILENISRTAYDFFGWYSDSACTNKVTSIPANSTGKIDLYAKWEAIFDYSNGEVKGLTSYGETKDITDLVIPSKIDDVSVKKIGVHAFYNNDLESVTIPKSVTIIEGGAFYKEDSLKVYYEGTLSEWLNVEVGSNSFNDDELYINNEKVNEVTIPSSIKEIKNYAFNGIKIDKVTIHDEVTSVGKAAFLNADVYYKGNVEGWLNIDKGIASFGDEYSLFIDDSKVINLIVPKSVKELKDNALAGLNIETVTIHEEVTNIGNNALDINKEIIIDYKGTVQNWLNIDKKENSIYNAKLYVDDKLVTDIVVSDAIITVKENALVGIKGIESVTLHENITSIESNGLNNGAIINVYYNGSVKDWVGIDQGDNSINKGSYLYIDNNLVIDLIIDEETTEIKKNAFGSFVFESVTIHDEVNVIGENAFMKEGEITIYCEADSKPSLWDENWQIGNTVYFGQEW